MTLNNNEFVFVNDPEKGIYSGGFKVNSFLMNYGINPVTTFNNHQSGGMNDKVSSLFSDGLVIPNWVCYNRINQEQNVFVKGGNDDDDDDDDVIGGGIYESLLQLVSVEDKINNKKNTKKRNKNIKSKRTKKRHIS